MFTSLFPAGKWASRWKADSLGWGASLLIGGEGEEGKEGEERGEEEERGEVR